MIGEGKKKERMRVVPNKLMAVVTEGGSHKELIVEFVL